MKESKYLRRQAQVLKEQAYWLSYEDRVESDLLELQAEALEHEAQWLDELKANTKAYDEHEASQEQIIGFRLATIRYIRDDAAERNAAAAQINYQLARLAETFDDEPYIEPMPALDALWKESQ